jgi:hypothetical protein
MGKVLAFPGTPLASTPSLVDARPLSLCWCIQTYKDRKKLARCLKRLRSHYPKSRIVVLSDGDNDARLPPLCTKFGAEYVLGQRLFLVEHGGDAIHRMLGAFLLRGESDVLVKIDPDTFLRRPLYQLLDRNANAIAGTITQTEPEQVRAIQGGFIAITRAVAQKWFDAKLFESPRLKPPALEWVVSDACRQRASQGFSSHDWTIAWAARETRVSLVDHPEVRSYWHTDPPRISAMRAAAVSHPELTARNYLSWASFLARQLFRRSPP